MIEITLTQFINFINASGSPKLTVVKNAKCDGYAPMSDYWKILREAICEYHKASPTPDKTKYFKGIEDSIIDPKRQANYPNAIKNYKKLLGRKTISGMPIKGYSWKRGDLTVRINPELLLNIDGSKSLIKLYFPQKAIGKLRVELALTLMQAALPSTASVDTYNLYDVGSGKIYSKAAPNAGLMPLVSGEADSFITIWNGISCT